MYRLTLKDKYKKLINTEAIIEEDVGEYDENKMAVHGVNRNLMRNIPSFYDNLKVVHRRILFAMASMGLFPVQNNPSGGFSKASGIIGRTLEKFHAHGDISTYESLIFMRQPWRHMLPLVDTKGNYGTAENPDGYAQMRYVECRLSEFAKDCFFSEWDLKSDLVDKKLSYNGKDLEPLYFPAKYPLFLMSWGSGIGFGASTSSPGFLPQDAMQAIIDLIDNNDAEILLYPEDPMGCTILDKQVFKKFVDYDYSADEEILKFRMRSDYVIKNGRINIYNIPFEIKAITIIERLKKLVKEGKIDGIYDIESFPTNGQIPQLKGKSDTVEIHIELKKGFDPHILMQKLYKVTDLQATFSLNCNYVNMNRNKKFNLRQGILEWIKIRKKVLKRMYRLDLNKNSKRLHVLIALINLFNGNHIKEVIDIIRKNKKTDAPELLIKKFKISDYQASQISNMRIGDLSLDSYKGYVEERDNIEKKIDELQNILKTKNSIDNIIKSQMREGISKYYRQRQSKLIDTSKETELKETKHLVCVTDTGFIKRLPIEELSIGSLTDNSKLIYMSNNISSKNKIFTFTSMGKVYNETLSKITVTSPQGIGYNIKSKIQNNDDEPVFISSINGKETTKDTLIFITKNGVVKQTKMESYFVAAQNSSAIKLSPDDLLVSVLKTSLLDDRLLIYTKNGNCVLFNIKDITITARATFGTQGIRIEPDDEVIGAYAVKSSDEYIVTVTTKGDIKKFSIDSAFLNIKRGSNGISMISTKSDTLAYAISIDKKERHIKFINNEGIVYEEINTNDIITKTRLSNGDKLLSFGRYYGLIQLT